MSEKVDWMLGMSQNMINISERQGHEDIRCKSSEIRSNLLHMKLNIDRHAQDSIDRMEQMMRSTEEVMINMDHSSDQHKKALRSMMNYIIWMQTTSK